jgi:hypothetical protein
MVFENVKEPEKKRHDGKGSPDSKLRGPEGYAPVPVADVDRVTVVTFLEMACDEGH